MNIRQKYELKMLSDDGQMDMEKVAGLFSIHLRTVRYDIQILNEYLEREFGEGSIEVINKVASVTVELKERLKEIAELNVKDFYADRLDTEERMLLMLFDLCWSKNYGTIQGLAEKYCVSRATVNKDIVALKEYCSKNGISFVSSRGKGLCVEADEAERRKYLAKIIRDLSELNNHNEVYTQGVYTQWFRETDLAQIRKIVAEAEEAFGTYLADVAYEALVVHVALSIERFRSGDQYKNLNENQKKASRDSTQYKMAEKIVKDINSVFGICLPDAEIYYVALHIGAKSSAALRGENRGDASLEYYCFRMISAVGKKIGCDLTGDERLYQSLFQHINVCVYRKRSGMLLANPLKEELIESYPQLYKVILQVVKDELELEVMVPTDDEIAYILLHFATALYRKEQNADRLPDVVVVCATGVGTAELVVTGLKKNFCMNIKGAVAEHQLNSFLKKTEADLIVTTVPLKTDCNSVRVSPLLRREDIVKIAKRLLDLGFDLEKPLPDEAEWSDTARWLKELLYKYSGKEQEELLKHMLTTLPQKEKRAEKEKGYMLSELLNEQSIMLNVLCNDWQDCVRASGEILVKKGDITDAYIQAVIDNVNEVGPYIVITKGVAMPHATNKVGVNRTSMSFVRLTAPVNFGNKSNDPVKYIFMLATTDANSHLGALQDLAEFLEQKEFMAVLEAAKEPADIISYIKTHECSNR